ncbi:hypothetical protein B0O99DRAFT_643084, partial [Bisporella sp. PMI_857]
MVESTPSVTFPSHPDIQNAITALPQTLPKDGLGNAKTEAHLLSYLALGFNGPKTSANYYNFVTGDVRPIAEAADNIFTAF